MDDEKLACLMRSEPSPEAQHFFLREKAARLRMEACVSGTKGIAGSFLMSPLNMTGSLNASTRTSIFRFRLIYQ